VEGYLIVLGLVVAVVMWALGRCSALATAGTHADAIGLRKREADVKAPAAEFEAYRMHQETVLAQQKAAVDRDKQQNQSDREAVLRLAREKSQGFPWLARAYGEYEQLKDLVTAKYLESKPHPAPQAAKHVRQIAERRRVTEQKWRTLRYLLQYYEALFPWLIEFKDENVEDLLVQLSDAEGSARVGADESEDSVRRWVDEAEYRSLSTTERNQLALDRYRRKRKSKWEVGRDYERYVGYLYEKRGYAVRYQGILQGFEDLGRDLIAVKGDAVEIAQCKHWSQSKVIHEKHIFQLFGTTVEYWLANRRDDATRIQPWLFPELLARNNIQGVLYTSTAVSDKAREFSAVLGIRVIQHFPLVQYPAIKCNVSRRTGERIYHLPFDQQYDRTFVEDERNECYAGTVSEAEALGLRRAHRWLGASPQRTRRQQSAT
jgi:hypothetical protein